MTYGKLVIVARPGDPYVTTELPGVLLVAEREVSARSVRPFIDELLGRMGDLEVSVVVTSLDPPLPQPKTRSGMTTHVLFKGQPLCGFMAGHVPKDWPWGHNWVGFMAGHVPKDWPWGHNWVSITEVEWPDGKAALPGHPHCELCVECADLAVRAYFQSKK